MRVRQRERLRIFRSGPAIDDDERADRLDIVVYGRLTMPARSYTSLRQQEIRDDVSAYYTTRYTPRLDPVLREPGRFSIEPTLHPKFKGKTLTLVSADLNRTGRLVELRF